MSRSLFLNRDFLLYWLAIAGAALGDAFVFVALPFLVLDLGGPGAVALTVMLGSLARFFGPVIGAMADRWRLRLPLLASALLRSLIYGVLGALALTGGLSLWLVYAAALLNGALTTFVFSAGSVVVPALVPRGQLARANSLMQAAIMGVPLLGLGVGGALVAASGPAVALLVAAPAFLVLAAACLAISFPAPAAAAQGQPFLGQVLSGARYLAQAGPLALIFPMSLLLNASLAMMNVIMPVLMERSGHGAQGFGLFETAVSTGMLLGILAVSLVGQRLAPQYQIGAAHLAMAAGLAVMAWSGFAMLLGGGALLGFGIGFTEVAAVTLLQLAVPEGMRGKVLGAVLTANAVGLIGGSWLAGRLVVAAAAGPIFAVAAAVILGLGVLWTAVNLWQRQRVEALLAETAPAGD